MFEREIGFKRARCALTALTILVATKNAHFVNCWSLQDRQQELQHHDYNELVLHYTIDEEQPEGTLVATVKSDIKSFVHATADIQYQFLSPAPRGFVVEEISGVIRTSERLDRESYCPSDKEKCEVNAELVLNNRETQRITIIRVILTIHDVNDCGPTFSETTPIAVRISEGVSVGSSVPLPQAFDEDSTTFAVVHYELISQDIFGLRVEQDDKGKVQAINLVVLQQLDREKRASYWCQLIAADHFDASLPSAALNITVLLIDVNDNAPIFETTFIHIIVVENCLMSNTSKQLVRLNATDKDEGANGEIRYNFDSTSAKMWSNHFALDSVTGTLLLIANLDYEYRSELQLKIVATDCGTNVLSSSIIIILSVVDVNDNAPDITISALSSVDANGTTNVKVPENVAAGSFVAQVTVTDRDSTNDIINCNMTANGSLFNLVWRSPAKYYIVTTDVLDRELGGFYDLVVQCLDAGMEPLQSNKLLRVTITDENDNTPRFNKSIYTAHVIENNFEDSVVLEVTANDDDIGNNAALHYFLLPPSSDLFRIDDKLGVLIARSRFDREIKEQLQFPVYVKDNGTPSRTASATVMITIIDVNDEKPHFLPPSYHFIIAEDCTIGHIVGQVYAVDNDAGANGLVTYLLSLTGDSDKTFSIDVHSGDITLLKTLDRELRSIYTFVVLARDGGMPSQTATAQVTVVVSDVNDHAPVFRFPTDESHVISVYKSLRTGAAIAQIVATDDDDDLNGNVVFSIISGNGKGLFHLQQTTGTLTAADNIKLTNKVEDILLTLQASDQGTKSLTTQAQLVIRLEIESTFLIWLTNFIIDLFNLPDISAGAIIVLCLSFLLVAICAISTIVCTVKLLRKGLCCKHVRSAPKSESRITFSHSVSFLKSDISDDYF